MNKLENKYIDAYHVIFKEGNLNGEWCMMLMLLVK